MSLIFNQSLSVSRNLAITDQYTEWKGPAIHFSYTLVGTPVTRGPCARISARLLFHVWLFGNILRSAAGRSQLGALDIHSQFYWGICRSQYCGSLKSRIGICESVEYKSRASSSLMSQRFAMRASQSMKISFYNTA